jgi:hypothetical protein
MNKECLKVIEGMEQESGNNPFSAWISICSDKRLYRTSMGMSRLEVFKNPIDLSFGKPMRDQGEFRSRARYEQVNTAKGQPVAELYTLLEMTPRTTYSCLTQALNWKIHDTLIPGVGIAKVLLMLRYRGLNPNIVFNSCHTYICQIIRDNTVSSSFLTF